MRSPDITIVLNAHREGPLLAPTLRSLTDTALHAATRGLSVELVAVLDSPDPATRAALASFDSAAFARIERIEVAHRSLGPSRNAGLAAACGTFTATVDGDDLYSFNYLAEMHAAATWGGLIVAVPGITVWFDADTSVQRFEPLARSGRFRLLGAHTFISCILAPTAFLRDLGYRDCAGSRAYAYEDYDLNCRAVAAGADIRAAEDAALFYRRRAGSIMADIGDATRRIVPPNPLFDPAAVVAHGDGDAVVEDGETLRPGLHALRASHVLAELVAHAGAIEPRIELAKLREAPVWTNAMFARDFGRAYHDLCRRLQGRRFDGVLVVATLAGAPAGLVQIAESAGRRLIIETSVATPSPLALPDGAQAIGLGELPAARRAEMIVRLVHAFAPRAPLHLVLGGEGDALLGGLAEALEGQSLVVYDLGADGRAQALSPEAFAAIDLVVCDHSHAADALVARRPELAARVAMLPASASADEAARFLDDVETRLRPRPTERRWTRA